MTAMLLVVLLQIFPPAGLHASVPWQNEEFFPGSEARVVEKLQLESYYNYKELPAEQSLDAKHVPMVWSVPQREYKVFCEHTFILNEPERADQANVGPEYAAWYISAWQHTQMISCYDILGLHNTSYSIYGGLLSAPSHGSWLWDYLDHGGTVPDAWHVHLYAYEPEELLRFWNEIRLALDNNYDLAHKNGKVIPVILTEVAGISDSVETNCEVMVTLWNIVEADPLLHSAYWFTGAGWTKYSDKYSLVGANGELTEIGECFMGLKEERTVRIHLPITGGGQ